MNKKQIAKEWLYLLMAFGFGASVCIILVIFLGDTGEEFLDLLVIFGLGTYVFFQFVRSIIWAVKTVRSS